MHNTLIKTSAALLVAMTLPAQAALITDSQALAAPTAVIDFENYNGFITAGPEVLAPGVTFTGDVDAELGAYIRDLGSNGVWGVGNLFAAAGTDGVLSFTFDTLQSGIGAFVNAWGGSSFTVTAYGPAHQVLESYSLTFDTGIDSYNAGGFVGISRHTADIRSLSFSGNGMVADNLSHTAAVPEPATWALVLTGLLITAGLRKRKS